MWRSAEITNAPVSEVKDEGSPSGSSVPVPQLAAPKKGLLDMPPEITKEVVSEIVTEQALALSFFDLPVELLKRVTSEIVTEEALALSGRSLRLLMHNVLALLLTNRRLYHEASERIQHIAVHGSLNLYISPADRVVGRDEELQKEEILAFWERKLQLVPWDIFRRVKIFLMPGLCIHGLRSHDLERLFEITQVIAPRFQALLGKRVQNGDCKVELTCCELDGEHASSHQDGVLRDIPLPCWQIVDLDYLLEMWAWLRRTNTEQSYAMIHLPNVVLVTRHSNQLPLKINYFSGWLGRVWNTETPPAVTGPTGITRDGFIKKNEHEISLVDAVPSDICFLLRGAKFEDTDRKGPTLIHTDTVEIAFSISAPFADARKILAEIWFWMQAMPKAPRWFRKKYIELADDLHSKAHRPGRAGMEEITGRLEYCLRQAKTLHHMGTSNLPVWENEQEA